MTKGEFDFQQEVWQAIYDTLKNDLGHELVEPLTLQDVDKLAYSVYSAVRQGNYFVHGGQIDLVHDHDWIDTHHHTEEYIVWVELEDNNE